MPQAFTFFKQAHANKAVILTGIDNKIYIQANSNSFIFMAIRAIPFLIIPG